MYKFFKVFLAVRREFLFNNAFLNRHYILQDSLGIGLTSIGLVSIGLVSF